MLGASSKTHSNPAASGMGRTAASGHPPTTSSTLERSRNTSRPSRDRDLPSSAPLPSPTENILGPTATGWKE
eukprot:7380333-Prymnesium_polylepis.1